MQTTDCMQPYLLGRCAAKMLNVFDTAGFEHGRNVTMCHKHSRGNSFRFMVSLRSRRLHHVGISFRFIHCLYVFCMSFGIKAGQMSLFKLKMNQRLKKKKLKCINKRCVTLGDSSSQTLNITVSNGPFTN